MSDINEVEGASWSTWSRHVLIELQSLRKDFSELRNAHADAILEQTKQFANDLAGLKQFHNDDIDELADKISKVYATLVALQTEIKIKSGMVGAVAGGIAGIIGTVVAEFILAKIKGG